MVSYSPSIATMTVSLAVFEIFTVKEWRDLEIAIRGCSRSLKMAPFDRPYATSYWSAPFSSYLTLINIVTLKSGLEVIQSGTIRTLGCGFLFAFHSNYLWLYLASFLSYSEILVENREFFIPPLHSAPRLGGSRRNIAILFGMEKLEWLGYPMVKKIWRYLYSFWCNSWTWQTDRQTDTACWQ